MRSWKIAFILFITATSSISPGSASSPSKPTAVTNSTAEVRAKLQRAKEKQSNLLSDAIVFDLPVTYNRQVAKWINHYQGPGRKWFRTWLERSYRYLPYIQRELREQNLPLDLAYMVMVESGFSHHAKSSADAVGPWQFIESTAARYGLRINWWLDERRDLKKSTRAAIAYINDLYSDFGSWYLVAASYNMGENGLRRRIARYGTRDFWQLIQLGALPEETQNYVPKIIATMMIAKAPSLYGFRNLERREPLEYDMVYAPGGTHLDDLASILGVTRKTMKDLNAELILGYIPRQVSGHMIRVPKGAARMIAGALKAETTNTRVE
ncbi:MAG: lytic transglycosylase domain-containing protein [Bdellovibrionaceae bacterium]|nr:lytic transglycosylase domain-containing protein [Pseudobdellovibrionaceae bacterium]